MLVSLVNRRILRAAAPLRRSLGSAVQAADAVDGLSDEHRAVYEAARAFGDAELLPHAADWDRDEHFPVDQLRAAAALGFGAIGVSPDHGGSGLDRLGASLIYEALSNACASTSAYLSIHNMVANAIETHGTDAQRAELLPEMATMEKFASYCLTEPNAGSDAASLVTKAEKKGDGYVINGSKAFISGAGASDVYLVMTRTGGEGSGAKGITAFLVHKDDPGVGFGAKERKLGWNSQPTRVVTFDDVAVGADRMVGQLGKGFSIAMGALDGGRVSIASCSIGGAQACFDAAVDYARERRQFGTRIADFQYTQFRLADMAAELTAARALVRAAARAVDAKSPRATYQSAMAKRFATDVGFKVANEALQIHGGYGYLKDYPIERYLRDLRVHQILEGTNEIMRVVMSRQILQE